jgi:hypothetical protein
MMSGRTNNPAGNPRNEKRTWTSALRSPWTVACATVAVVLGPAAVTASALERANSAPLHGASAPDRPERHDGGHRHHAAPPAQVQYGFLPRSTHRDRSTAVSP